MYTLDLQQQQFLENLLFEGYTNYIITKMLNSEPIPYKHMYYEFHSIGQLKKHYQGYFGAYFKNCLSRRVSRIRYSIRNIQNYAELNINKR